MTINDVYLDCAATSRWKPVTVYETMDKFMRDVGASPGRSVHGPGITASRIVSDTRDSVARLFNVDDPARIIFTMNCTEGLNLALKGILRKGGSVVTTSIEHNSVMRPLSYLVAERGIEVTRVAASTEGFVDPAEVKYYLRDDTSLLVMTHASNVVGSIQPVAECCDIAHAMGIPVLIDAAQTAGCIPIDLKDVPVDMLAFSGHKGLMGPQGTGGLYISKSIDITPLRHGGTGSASSEEVQPETMPEKFEGGTPNTPGLAGLGAAARFVHSHGVPRIRRRLTELGSAMLSMFEGKEWITLYGSRSMDNRTCVFSFRLEGWDPAEAALELATRYRIMTRVGLHCAPSAHRTLGTFPVGTIRASLGYHNTMDDIERLSAALKEMKRG